MIHYFYSIQMQDFPTNLYVYALEINNDISNRQISEISTVYP